jgi:hypothetical protein
MVFRIRMLNMPCRCQRAMFRIAWCNDRGPQDTILISPGDLGRQIVGIQAICRQ